MFNKKELEEIKKQINSLGSKAEENNIELKEKQSKNEELLNLMLTKILKLEENQNYFSNKLKEETQKIQELNENFEKSLGSFKVLQNTASKKLLEETNTEIKTQLNSLMKTANNYRQIETNLLDTKGILESLNVEINKFNMISKDIKKTDFQLANYVDKVTEIDKEKLRLMQENDRLKKLISKERRIRR